MLNWQEQTAEVILDNLLNRVPNDFDKREGSVIYDALAPAAYKVAEMYSDLEVFLRLMFADTSSGEYLTRRASELGVERKLATAAVRKGIFFDLENSPMQINIGVQFVIDTIIFEVIEEIGVGEYQLQSLTPGEIGNQVLGQLLPIRPISNLGKAIITEVLIPGTDDENDANLFTRYSLRVKGQATSGNVAHYKKWALEVSGVGDVKITSIWNGPGTVKVTIVGSDKRAASNELVQIVTEHIENVRPIGATVTVMSASERSIKVDAKLVLANGYSVFQVQEIVSKRLIDYFAEVAFKETYISYAKIGNLLLDTPGVGDYSNLVVNEGVSNVLLGDEEIPILSTVSLEV